MALAARPIVVLIGCLFNRLALDIGVSPLIKLDSIKSDTLFANGEFPHEGPNRLVELIPAHAEIAVGITGPDEPGQYLRYLGCSVVCHRRTAPGRAGRRKGLFGGDLSVDREDLFAFIAF